jgi:hypothetical protein
MENPSSCLVVSISIHGPIIIPPLVSRSKFKPHIDGSTYGQVAIEAPIQAEVLQPQRGKRFTVSSALPMMCSQEKLIRGLTENYEEEDTLVGRLSLAGSDLDVNLVVLEQTMPHGYVAILAKNLNCYLYGIYSDVSTSLVITNVANYYELITEQNNNNYMVHRMGMHINLCNVIYTKRLCSRFFRYRNAGLTPPKMFSALERSLSTGF